MSMKAHHNKASLVDDDMSSAELPLRGSDEDHSLPMAPYHPVQDEAPHDEGETTTDTAVQEAGTTSLPESKRLSPMEAAVTLVKGNMGPGILNLPHAFCIAGYALGSGLFFFIAAQGIYSMSLLVHCKNRLAAARAHNPTASSSAQAPPQTFMGVAEASLGPAGGRMVEIFLFILQGGVCCVFLSLLTTNLRAAVPLLTAWESTATVTAVLLVTVSLLRFIKDLVWLNVTANGLMLLAIVTALVASIVHAEDAHRQNNRLSAAHWTGKAVITFTSDLFFAFEGIGLVLPVENSFDHNNGYKEFTTVLAQSMSFVATAFVVTGAVVSVGFAGNVHTGSITAFLRSEYPDCLWYSIVNGAVMLAVGLTFPLQLTPAAEVLDTWLSSANTDHYENVPNNITDDAVAAEETNLPATGDGLLVHPGSKETFKKKSQQALAATGETQSPSPPVVSDDADDIAVSVPRERQWAWLCHHYSWMMQRWAMVLFFALIVIVVDDLAILMSLFGSVGQTGLAATPCLVHLALQHQGIAPRASWPQIVLDVTVVVFCTVVMFAGFFQALDDIWRKNSSSNGS